MSRDWRYTAAIIVVVAAPIAIEIEGALYLSATWKSASYGIATNAVSQGIANGGDLTKINTIETLSEALPGIAPTILGESLSLPVGNILNGNFIPTTPKSFEQGLLQIGGGLLSNGFGNSIGGGLNGSLTGSAAGAVYIEASKLVIETGSNVLPNLGK